MNKVEAFGKIQKKCWYLKTSSEVKDKLNGLGDAWTGYLVDLANRSDIVGGLKHLAMVDLLLGGFGCITRFLVTNGEKEYTYEYFSWSKGPKSGAKGLVFLADKNGKVNHFAYLEAEKFAAGGITCVDIPGGFAEEIDMATATKFLASMTRELTEEFGAKSLEIISIENLGQYTPDYGMTNNAPFIFSIIVSADIQYDGINTDDLEVKSKILVRPIGDLKKITATITDGFFLACIAKLWANNSLPI